MESYTCKEIPTTGIQLIYDLLRKNYNTQGVIYPEDYRDTLRISRMFDLPGIPCVRRVLHSSSDVLITKIEFDNFSELFVVEPNAIDYSKDPPKYQSSANYILTCNELLERTEFGVRTLWNRGIHQSYGQILDGILRETKKSHAIDNINGVDEDSSNVEFPEFDDYIASMQIDNSK